MTQSSDAAPSGDRAPRLCVEPTTGRPVLIAPQRQQRPILTGAGAGVRCPFCPGHEADTPPEVQTVPERSAAATGWLARAFPNKFPACADHEVIAEGNVHSDQPAELPAEVWRHVLTLWQARIRALERRPGVAVAFLFKNVGALAGASIPHNHTQLMGLRELPPRLQLELRRARESGGCAWCAEAAAPPERVICGGPAHVVVAPATPKLPHETWLLPRRCDDDFLTTDVAALAPVLQRWFAALRGGLGGPAFNLWLHRIPGERFHWHFELQPRTGQLAGLELGGDMYINSWPPESSAAKLRGGLPSQ